MIAHTVSAWSAVSPYGIGAKPFADGLALGPAPAVPPDPAAGAYPGALARPVPDFDVRRELGRKGTRSIDRASALAVTAVRELIDTAGPPAAMLGLALGTTAGSAQSMLELTTDMLVNERPFYVDPARIPNAVMNGAAAQCAIRHRLTGPNATVGGGRAAGLLALRYALRLLDAGRADAVLCGGVEELTPARAWLEHHARWPGEPPPVLGEGAGLVLLEPAGRPGPALADVPAVEVNVYADRRPAAALAGCVRRALGGAGLTPADVGAVCATGGAGPLGDAERDALAEVFAGRAPRVVAAGQPWGDAGAATVPFQLAAVLAAADAEPGAAGRAALITVVDRDSLCGCAVLRLGPVRP
jgi:3-oxoacyl-[acyl-carrier-protein] synthase II